MKSTIKLEELAMFILSILLFAQLELKWWLFPALIFAPDIGMLGYLFNTRAGAIMYNIFHHKGIAIVVYIIGWYFGYPWFTLAGIILFGHSSLDRLLGYGLKYDDSFHHTHLGWIKPPENK